MQRNIFLALIGLALAPGLSQAACSIGPPRDPDATYPPVSTTTSPSPLFSGATPSATMWFTDTNPIPPEPAHAAFWTQTDRRISRFHDLVPAPISSTTTQPESGGGGGGGTCQSTRTAMPPSNIYTTSYLEQIPIASGLKRQRIEFDMTYYEGNSDPVSGERSYWPVAAWNLPTGAPNWGSTMRLDYSGWQTGFNWPNVNSQFYIYVDDVFIANLPVETVRPVVELLWSINGQLLLKLDVGATPGSTVYEVPIELYNPVTGNFQPSSFMVGRVYLPYWLRPSKGTIYAYSHLIESGGAP